MVEFAFILPLLVLIIFAIVDLSLALYDKAMITNASREGARAGIVYRFPAPTNAQLTTEIGTVVNNYLLNHLVTFGGSTTATTTVPTIGASPGGELRVRVAYSYRFIVLSNLVPGLPRNINMAAETVMRME
jgi:Flp pilus assembly protein TadG